MTAVLESLKNKRKKVDELNQKIKTLKADLNKMQDEHESSEIEAQQIRRRSRSDSIKMEEMELSAVAKTVVKDLDRKLAERKAIMNEISANSETIKVPSATYLSRGLDLDRECRIKEGIRRPCQTGRKFG